MNPCQLGSELIPTLFAQKYVVAGPEDATSRCRFECIDAGGNPAFTCTVHGGFSAPWLDGWDSPDGGTLRLGGLITAEGLGLPRGQVTASPADLRRALTSGDAAIRRVAATAARSLDDPSLAVAVLPLLADPDEYVRKQAAWSLGVLGSDSDASRDPLYPLLRDPAERVRDFAAFALTRLHSPRGTALTLGIMNDPARSDVRRGEAAVALGDAGASAHREEIAALLAPGASPELSRRVRQALEKLDPAPR
jgi:hypothetical protein